MWAHPEYPSQGIPALVAAKAAKNQGEPAFMRYHLAAFDARHEEGKDISDREILRDIAKTTGLDLVEFEQDMESDKTWQAVGEDHTESKGNTAYLAFQHWPLERDRPFLQSFRRSRNPKKKESPCLN